MSTTFGTIKTNVSQRIGDTTDAMKTIIGTYINQRYKDVLRRINWKVIDEDYSITATSASTVASASTYTLPSNFGKELYVYDTTNKNGIPRLSFEKLETEHWDELYDTGNIEYYTIFETTESSAATAARQKKIKFWRTPTTDWHFTIPYILSPADLSGATDELVLDCETAVEYGATSDAWAYKRQFAKSQYYEVLYEKSIQALIWDKENQPNELPLMNPLALNRDEGI